MLYLIRKIKYFIVLSFIFLLAFPVTAAKVELPKVFPRLANYFLKWELSDYEAENLAKWDLLILDMEVQENSPEALKKIRQLNPDVVILAYITSQEIMSDFKYYHLAHLRPKLEASIIDSWYLKDTKGNKVTNWPGTYMLNLSDGVKTNSQGQRFNDFLPEFILNNIKSTGLWDGVFYDNTWGDVTWIANNDLDLNNDGVRDGINEANANWASGFKKMLQKTRNLVGNDFLIMGNGKLYEPYQGIMNGMMFENFPSFWEGDGTWAGSMKNYLKLPSLNVQPSVSVLNTYNKSQNNFSLMRFGLTSTLLGEGFFSYDYDTSNHGQLWWYDEYSVNLGKAISTAYNPNNNSTIINNGLFRRDFENASVFVNAGNKREIQIFSQENFARITGTQDPNFNSGERINFLDLQAKTGAILLKSDQIIRNTVFSNGFLYRFFDGSGKQTQAATFSFIKAYPNNSEIILVSGDKKETVINAAAGVVKIIENGQSRSFIPFPRFKGDLSLAVLKNNNNFEKIVVGPGLGGGPQVLVFDNQSKLIANFFAYDKTLRTGVNVAVADVDNDGDMEIITAPGKGAEPLVKVFSLSGKLKYSFLAYDKNFRGGVSISAGDLNKNGFSEIITIPASSGGPHVRIFNFQGRAVGGFFAFDKTERDKFKITLGDLNGDGKMEIVVGRQSPY